MNIFKKTGSLTILLVVLFLFLFSFYKIINLTGLGNFLAFGNEWGCCNECFCPDCPDCDPCCPTPTPIPTLTPTPTPTPTPTEGPEPTPIPTLTPTPTPIPGNGGGDNGGDGNGGASAPVCDREKPGTPVLTSLKRIASDQVKLTWTEADRATYYSLAYGLASGDYQFGVDNAGQITEFVVGGLDSNASYCFVVRANNECQPGDFSNELCEGETKAVGGLILGASTLAATGSSLGDFIFTLEEKQEKIIDWLSLDFLTEELPDRIELPGNQIDLAVNQAQIKEGNWPVAEKEANFLLGSALPGKDGNSIFYAHNKSDLFGSLHQVKVGEVIKVTTATQAFEYEITETKVVASDDLSVLEKEEGKILTLFTCTGVNDENRLVVKAKLKAV